MYIVKKNKIKEKKKISKDIMHFRKIEKLYRRHTQNKNKTFKQFVQHSSKSDSKFTIVEIVERFFYEFVESRINCSMPTLTHSTIEKLKFMPM